MRRPHRPPQHPHHRPHLLPRHLRPPPLVRGAPRHPRPSLVPRQSLGLVLCRDPSRRPARRSSRHPGPCHARYPLYAHLPCSWAWCRRARMHCSTQRALQPAVAGRPQWRRWRGDKRDTGREYPAPPHPGFQMKAMRVGSPSEVKGRRTLHAAAVLKCWRSQCSSGLPAASSLGTY